MKRAHISLKVIVLHFSRQIARHLIMDGESVGFLPERIFGGFILFTATATIIMQLIFMAVISKKCGFGSDFAFTLMCLISMMDCIQLLNNGMRQSGMFVSIPIMGAFMGSSWILMAFTIVFLAFHRFIFTLRPLTAKYILSPRLLKLSPFSAVTFNEKDFWFYDAGYPYSWISDQLDTVSNYSTVFLSTILYTASFTILFCKRPMLRTSSEFRITLLVFPFCAYQVLCFLVSEFVLPIFPRSFYTNCVEMVLWVFWNGAGTMTYIIFCRSFRSELKQMVCKILLKMLNEQHRYASTKLGPTAAMNVAHSSRDVYTRT
ncbi:hypothetical protein OSTOST_13075 [Ostertagia ostertagi]